MSNYKTLQAKIIETKNGFGIVRCVEKKVDYDGVPFGQRLVFYDVCVDNGQGHIVESFKTLAAARKYVKDNHWGERKDDTH